MIQLSNTLRVGALALAALSASLAGCGMMKSDSSTVGAVPDNVVKFAATLNAASEVPPNPSTGTGALTASLDKGTNVLSWRLSYEGLSGPATMAHFHGPAAPGTNAGVVVPFPSAASPASGSVTLTAAQVADLRAGKWYANVHTQKNPGGEIRGQVTSK
jgi:hypothetical protein